METDEVKCPECGKSFAGEYILTWHREAVHAPSLQVGPNQANLSATAVGRQFCENCGYALDAGGICRRCSQNENTLRWDEEEAKKKIKGAVIAGSISSAVTLILALTQVLGTGSGVIFDAFFMFAMTMGVLFRNRACAVILFFYWIISKLLMLSLGAVGWFGLPLGILFGYFFYGAIPATFALHRIKAAKRDAARRLAAEKAAN